MLFEQLAQFSPACSNVHRSEAAVPHGGKKTPASSTFQRDRIYFIQCYRAQSFDEAVQLTC